MSEGRYIKRTELGGSPWVERFDGRIIDCGRPTTFRRVGDAINACALANYADREARKECAASLAALTAERDAAIERTNVDRYALQQKDNAIEEFQRIVATLTAERTALHEMFQRAATADRRTPMTKEDAALLTIGNDTYIVPKAIAARVAELEGALASIGFVGEGDFKEETPAATGELHLRPSVAEFAQRMETVLRRHDATKGGQANWRKDGVWALRDRLLEEVEELRSCLIQNWKVKVAAEAIDVANFAMMIADKCDPLPTDPPPAAKPETAETPAFKPRRFVKRNPDLFWQTEPGGQVGFYKNGKRRGDSIFKLEHFADPEEGFREVPIPDETSAPTCGCPDCTAIREGRMKPLGYQCQGCGHSFADPIPTIYLSRGKCERCAAPTCGTCGGKGYVMTHEPTSDHEKSPSRCPACAAAEGGVA